MGPSSRDATSASRFCFRPLLLAREAGAFFVSGGPLLLSALSPSTLFGVPVSLAVCAAAVLVVRPWDSGTAVNAKPVIVGSGQVVGGPG